MIVQSLGILYLQKDIQRTLVFFKRFKAITNSQNSTNTLLILHLKVNDIQSRYRTFYFCCFKLTKMSK